MVNNAIAALNADKLDSAQYYATTANTLYSGSPYGAMVLGNIANKKNNNDEAIKHWQAAATYSFNYQRNWQHIQPAPGCQYLWTFSAAGRPQCDVTITLHPSLPAVRPCRHIHHTSPKLFV